MASPPYTSHENVPSGLKVNGGGGQTDRQDGYLISLVPFLESRLKSHANYLNIMSRL
jgi:hypothetical protein